MSDSILDKPMIVNWALLELGQTPNFTTDLESRLGAMVDVVWQRTVARCFGLADWPFCRRTYKLTRRVETPMTGYRWGFDLPQPRFGPPLRYLEDPRRGVPVRETRIEGEVVYADVDALYAVCRVAVDPQDWDQQFADCFAVALASGLAIPLTQDPDLAAEKERLAFGTPQEGGAGGMFGRLIAQHRASGPVSAPVDTQMLSGDRAGGAWHGRY